MIFWTTAISGILLMIYFMRRNKKVLSLRLDIIEFVYSGDYKEVTKKKKWFDEEIPSYTNMWFSVKPLSSFIVGEYAEAYLNYSKIKINGN